MALLLFEPPSPELLILRLLVLKLIAEPLKFTALLLLRGLLELLEILLLLLFVLVFNPEALAFNPVALEFNPKLLVFNPAPLVPNPVKLELNPGRLVLMLDPLDPKPERLVLRLVKLALRLVEGEIAGSELVMPRGSSPPLRGGKRSKRRVVALMEVIRADFLLRGPETKRRSLLFHAASLLASIYILLSSNNRY